MRTLKILALFAFLALALALPAGAQQIVAPYIGTDGYTPVFGIVNLKSTTTQSIIAAQAATIRTYITQIQCINPTATSVIVNVYDGGGSTGGTIKTRIPCRTALDGEPVINFVPPLKMTAATVVNVGIGTTIIAAGAGDGLYVILNGFTAR